MAIHRLLIANRGEIAVRVARTARRLAIDTVGVYSESDRGALHTRHVDVAVALGGASAAESYLRGDAIIAAARATGADAVHPGYGFLAENADFAEQVIAAGLVWVGPTPDQIRLLGDKVAAKRAAREAGVPTTAFVEVVVGEGPDVGDLPFPVLVKAAAGGGGRGMRVVERPEDLADAVAGASREAQAAFGDGAVFIEPYLARGRHVEVQVFGDSHGNVIHLGERECSIQRRNQKVIEEAPSAGIDDDTRRRLCDGAVALARHVGYRNAGTVEFMVGVDGDVTFLEVNTRLQVEHPVTEAVTGLDLVELQLTVAAGEPLPVAQDDVVVTGHAIEARVVAEDPTADWMPSTGRVTRFAIGGGTRVDTGFEAGSTVSADYDSLLAKVIAHAPTRDRAARVLGRSLATSQIAGVRTNLDLLADICADPDFLAADTTTDFLTSAPRGRVQRNTPHDVALLLGAVIAVGHDDRRRDATTGWAPSGWRNLRTQGQRQVWEDDRGVEVRVEYVVDERWTPDGTERTVEAALGPWPLPGTDGVLSADERDRVVVRVVASAGDEHILEIAERSTNGDGPQRDGTARAYTIRTAIEGRRGASAADRSLDPVTVHTVSATAARSWTLRPRFELHDLDAVGAGPISPLPGTVIAVHVAPGDEVTDGQVLMVVEAMKMEHKITAHGDAVVGEVRFAVGDRVDTGDLLVALEPRSGSEDS